jgi:hypothetical protein
LTVPKHRKVAENRLQIGTRRARVGSGKAPHLQIFQHGQIVEYPPPLGNLENSHAHHGFRAGVIDPLPFEFNRSLLDLPVFDFQDVGNRFQVVLFPARWTQEATIFFGDSGIP